MGQNYWVLGLISCLKSVVKFLEEDNPFLLPEALAIC